MRSDAFMEFSRCLDSIHCCWSSLRHNLDRLLHDDLFLKLCQQQARAQERINQGQRNRGGIPQNIARYRKTVSTIAWVQLVLLSSYLPYFIVSVLSLTVMSNRELIELLFLATLTQIYFNSTLNPILYCWKIREVRRVAKDTIRQICC